MIYNKVVQAAPPDKQELFREEMLAPFMKKWEMQQIPFRTHDPHGFDVLTLNRMMNLAPEQMTEQIADELACISSDAFWSTCEQVVQHSLHSFSQHGVELPVTDYLFTIQLGNPDSLALQLSEGYSGDGGIPGYIMGTLLPNPYTLSRVKALLAHECNHNVRYQFITWDHEVTLGEWVVSEGLAESYATGLYGTEMLGPWVAKTSSKVLNAHIKPIFRRQLQLTGFHNIMPYLYGDQIAKLQHMQPVDMPYGAGYACGYYLIQYYLKQTGKSIYEATITPAAQIWGETEGFWDEETIVVGS